MNGENLNAAVNLLSTLLSQAATISAAVGAASAEGRDLTDAELDAVFQADNDAKTKLEADIKAQEKAS
jgi:hypothetical protein